jgi:hypothetical protein
MKKSLIILSVLLVIILGALIAVPIFFKDHIREAIDSEISRNINAKVYFNTEKIGVSLFKRFPDITLTLQDVGIVGVEPFEEDTLASLEAFDLTIDLISLILGDQIQLKSINLISPRIIILVNEDGQANYDILVESEDSKDKAGEETTLSVSIDSWKIRDGKLVYYDYSNDFLMALDEISHSGSGDFTMDIFDINTFTSIGRMMASYKDIEYLRDKRLEANIILNADLVSRKYTFRENTISINDLNFGFEGFIEMLENQYNLDLFFLGNNNSVKSILSLIPGLYTEDFKGIQADGILDFKGYIKGIYDEEKEINPAFNIQMSSENGRVKYPDLPESISNIQFDLNIDNNTGAYEETVLDLKKLHMDLGKNPVDAAIIIKNLTDYEIEAVVKASLDLKDMMKIYPLDSTDLSGIMDIDLAIHGVYDTVRHTIPTTGDVYIKDLYFKSNDLPHGLRIESSIVSFSTKNVDVKEFKGAIGNSHLALKGYLSNYIDYFIDDKGVLTGKFDFSSDFVDMNEWMAGEEEAEIEADTSSVEVIKIPGNIDFVLDSRIDKVLYDNLELKGFKGQLVIRNGAIHFNEVGFNTLGGLFNLNGKYVTKDEDHPTFDFNLAIKDLSIPESYKYFITIQKLAPIAEIMAGSFSSDFKLKGELKKNFLPDLLTLSGSGLLDIATAAINGSQSKVISGIATASKLNNESVNVGLSNVILKSQIENGRVFTQPFNIRFGKNNALIAGSSGLDGSLDYNVKLDVPPQVIQTAGSFLSSLTGKEIKANAQDVKLNLKVTGSYDNPQIKILGAEMGESKQAAEEALKAAVEDEKEKAFEEADKMLEAETEKAPEEVQKILEEHEEEIEKAKDKLRNFFKKGGGR